MSTPASPARERAGVPVGELVFAAGVAGLGVFALVRASSIRVPIASGALGPRTLPYIVGALLLVVGVATIVGILRGERGEAEVSEDVDPDGKTNWLTVGILIALFVVHAFLIQPFGWPVAGAVLFIGAAWTFGAKPRWRAAVGGVLLALLVQIVFAGLLGVSLPPGPFLEGVAIFHG